MYMAKTHIPSFYHNCPMMEEEQKKERIQTKSLKSQTETESSSPRDSRIIKGF